MIRLENWSIVNSKDNPFLAPELRRRSLHGNVYGHPVFEDGKSIKTSPLIEIDLEKNVAKTQNTEYVLGEVSTPYMQWLKDNNMELQNFIE